MRVFVGVCALLLVLYTLASGQVALPGQPGLIMPPHPDDLVRSHDLVQGLVGWWRSFAHLAGGIGVYDLMQTKHGVFTFAGPPSTSGWTATTRPGGVAQWNLTTSDVITIGNYPQVSFERTDAFSVALWFNWTQTGVRPMVSKVQGSSPWAGWAVEGNSGDMRLRLLNTVTDSLTMSTSGNGFDDGNWHYGVVTYDGGSVTSSIKWWVDGVSLSTTSQGSTGTLTGSILSSTPLLFGGVAPVSAAVYAGSLDDVRIWKRALTSSEAVQAYQEAKRGDPTLLPLPMQEVIAVIILPIIKHRIFHQ